jgi:hypothetical protein
MKQQEFRAISALLQQIADNTRPADKGWQVIAGIASIVSIGGIVGIIERFIQWVWR